MLVAITVKPELASPVCLIGYHLLLGSVDSIAYSNAYADACVPDCPDKLKPFVGKKFNTLDAGIAFYDAYAREAGFDTRKRGIKSSRECVTWQYMVCNRQGLKNGLEMDHIHAREGFINKRRRPSKRCDCKARISFRYIVMGNFVGYMVHEFVEEHNHSMIGLPYRRYMHLNRKLTEVHKKFIWDCTKANIGPTMTFKFLNEFLGGYDTVGITVTELRNAVQSLKTYVEGSDAQMLLDEMARRKKACDGFTYHYKIGSENELVAIFWCDATAKKNYQMYGDVVSFDSTYNTNRYCLIIFIAYFFCKFQNAWQ